MEYGILLAFTALVALVVHSFYGDFWRASVVVAVISTIVGLLVIFVKERFPVALVANLPFAIANPGLPCFAVAAIVGIPFRLHRKAKRQTNLPSE